MRVALITDGIAPYVIGGMQKHSFYLLKYLAKNNIDVDLFHYNDSTYDIHQLEFFSEEEKRYIHPVVMEFPVSPRFPGHYIYRSYKYSSLVFEAIKPKLSTYDFIYTKGFTGWKLISEKRKGKVSCCNIGIKFHGYEMFQIAPDFKTKLQHYLLRPFVKRLSQQADFVFSYGGKITQIIKSIGVQASHIIEIPSGVELSAIQSSLSNHPNTSRKFVFLGRAERRKGIIELNDVLRQLISEKADFKFECIGPIPEEQKIDSPFVHYHGELRDPEKIHALLQQNDILVCPSWSEGFPNVILEAMACGLAIIATDVGAVSAIVSSKNGWLIKPADPNELYKAMKESLTGEHLMEKKEFSLQLVKQIFNWDRISQQTIAWFKKV